MATTFCSGTSSEIINNVNQILEEFKENGVNNGLLSRGVIDLDVLNNPTQAAQAVDAKLNALQTSGVIPMPPPSLSGSVEGGVPGSSDALQTYIGQMNSLQSKIKREYCFYERRYLYAVQQFLGAYTDSSNSDAQAQTFLNTARERAATMNTKLNTLIALINGLAKRRYSNYNQYNTSINSLNTDLQQIGDKLQSQSALFKENASRADINKRMVEYTTEKNRANQNLLALYFTLNVVAIASLFILAKNM